MLSRPQCGFPDAHAQGENTCSFGAPLPAPRPVAPHPPARPATLSLAACPARRADLGRFVKTDAGEAAALVFAPVAAIADGLTLALSIALAALGGFALATML